MNRSVSIRVYLGAAALLLSALCGSSKVWAQSGPALPVVKPVMACEELGKASIGGAIGAEVTLQASTADTPKGKFCHVTGVIAPAIHFEVDLPTERCRRRFIPVVDCCHALQEKTDQAQSTKVKGRKCKTGQAPDATRREKENCKEGLAANQASQQAEACAQEGTRGGVVLGKTRRGTESAISGFGRFVTVRTG